MGSRIAISVMSSLTAFFFSGRFIVTVTTASVRSTSSVSTKRDDNQPVGFNPFRQQRRRSSDYVFVAAAFVLVAVLLAWALLA